jgi:hypothetical protein
MVSGEKRLWQAVLDIAISDALRARFSPVALRHHLNWFREDNPQFQMACDLADSSPDTVRNLLITLLKTGDEDDIKTFIRSAKFYSQREKKKKEQITN